MRYKIIEYQKYDWIEAGNPLCKRDAETLPCFASFLLIDFFNLTCNFYITYLNYNNIYNSYIYF